MTESCGSKDEENIRKRLFKFLDSSEVSYGVQATSEPFPLPFELSPAEFMSFAQHDIEENTEKSLVNALSNIKRAIDCRVASLVFLFGFYEISKKGNWSFPQSADFLVKIGIVAPNILRKINRKRNKLEHEFRKPNKDDVVDFLDVATLFMSFTNQFLQRIYGEFDIVHADTDYPMVFLYLYSEKGIVEVSFEESAKTISKISVSVRDEDYLRILRHLVNCIIQR